MVKWDAVIIGAGIAGLEVGALLANSGKKVLILEKDRDIGGRAFATNYRGHILDNGVHGLMSMGYTEEIFSRLGRQLSDGVFSQKTEVLHGGRWYDMRDLVPRQELRDILGEGVTNQSYHELERYNNISMKEWVSQRTDNEMIHLYFWYQVWAVLGGSRYEDMAAGPMLVFLKELRDKRDTYRRLGAILPLQGLSALTDPLAEIIREKGGEIRANSRATNIVIEEGKARGVRVETGERVFASQFVDTDLIEAPIIVCTVPIWDLFTVVSEAEFPAWYVEWIEGIKHRTEPIFTLNCAMDALLWDDWTITRWVPRLPKTGLGAIFEFFPPYGEAVGQYQAIFWLQALWNEVPSLFEIHRAKNRIELGKIFDLFEEDIKILFPDFEKHCLWKIRHLATFGLAEAPGVLDRPSIEPPGVEGLYLVSDYVREARTIGMESVACAVLHFVDNILRAK